MSEESRLLRRYVLIGLSVLLTGAGVVVWAERAASRRPPPPKGPPAGSLLPAEVIAITLTPLDEPAEGPDAPAWGIGVEGRYVFENNERAYLVEGVAEGLPASRAGLVPGDRIVSANGSAAIVGAVRSDGPGSVRLEVRRGADLLQLEVEREAFPEPRPSP